MGKLTLAIYKRLLREEYNKYCRLTDDLTCGMTLAEFINPEIKRTRDNMMDLLAKCKQLESEATK